MSGYPETPEAVAFALMQLILNKSGGGDTTPAYLLDLFTVCLSATYGKREPEDCTIFGWRAFHGLH